MACPDLPQELVDMIIDEVGAGGDRISMVACSLTCHGWLHRSRFHIHAVLAILPTSRVRRLKEIYLPPLAIYIRKVHIMCRGPRRFAHDAVIAACPLFRRLQSVKALVIEGVTWDALPDHTRTTILSQFANTTTELSILDCSFWRRSDFVRLLTVFGAVTRIRISHSRWHRPDGMDASIDDERPMRLDHLVVGDGCTFPNVVARWASGKRAVCCIRRIHFTWHRESVDDLSNLLRRAGSSVKHLTLTFDNGRWLPPRSECVCMMLMTEDTHFVDFHVTAIDISQNTGLCELGLMFRQGSSRFTSLAWISGTLMALASVEISRVDIRVELMSRKHLTEINWCLIDSILGDRRLSAMLRVQVEVTVWDVRFGGGHSPLGMETVVECMPKLTARGILDVVVM